MKDIAKQCLNFSAQRDLIPINSFGPSPDKDWRYTDEGGHEHFYDKTASSARDIYPTLNEVTETIYYDDWDEGEGTYQGHVRWECKRCDEVIHPRQRWGETFYVPGATTYLLNGEPITEEEYYRLRAQLMAEQ